MYYSIKHVFDNEKWYFKINKVQKYKIVSDLYCMLFYVNPITNKIILQFTIKFILITSLDTDSD